MFLSVHLQLIQADPPNFLVSTSHIAFMPRGRAMGKGIHSRDGTEREHRREMHGPPTQQRHSQSSRGRRMSMGDFCSSKECFQRCYGALPLPPSCYLPSHYYPISVRSICSCALMQQCREKQKNIALLPRLCPPPHLLLCGCGLDDAE